MLDASAFIRTAGRPTDGGAVVVTDSPTPNDARVTRIPPADSHSPPDGAAGPYSTTAT